MITITPTSGETRLELTKDSPAISMGLAIDEPNLYSIWTSLSTGKIHLFHSDNLHTPILSGSRELVVTLDVGSYILAIGGQLGRFIINVTPIPKKPVVVPDNDPTELDVVVVDEANAQA